MYFLKMVQAIHSTPRKSRLRSSTFREGNAYSLQGQCFLCNEKFSDKFEVHEKKKEISKRIHRSQVSLFTHKFLKNTVLSLQHVLYFFLHFNLQVTELGLKDRILQQAARRNDKWKEVIARIVPIPDLVAADAEYHRSCHKKFMKVRLRVKDTRGAPENVAINTAMNLIFSHIQSHDECQYSTDDLRHIGGK